MARYWPIRAAAATTRRGRSPCLTATRATKCDGYVALYTNTSGTLNNAVGNFSLFANTTGSNNSAVGYAALYRNTTGSNNNAQGFYALQSNTTGSDNIALDICRDPLPRAATTSTSATYGIAGESGAHPHW